MPRHVEPLGMGLWTAPNPAMLEPGQLSYLQNGVYLPGSQALQRARGRGQFGTVTATGTDVDGLRDVQFDNGDHYLIAMISGTAAGNGSYRYATVGDTGTFSTLASGFTAGSQLDLVHYRNRFFLLNGVSASADSIGSNTVVYLSATAAGVTPSFRQHGMLPVNMTPLIVTGSGTFSQSVTGYYEYWTTEVASITADGASMELESTFTAPAATVFVSSTAVVPTIQMPLIRNTGLTTSWRIYRSPKKDKETDKKFPTGFSISEVATATTAVPDTSVVSQTAFVSAANANGVGDGATIYADAANASAMFVAGANFATFTTPVLDIHNPVVKRQGLYGYNFGGFTGAVKGIEVELKAFSNSNPCPFSVTIGAKRVPTGDYAWNVLVGGPGPQAAARKSLPQPTYKSASVTATASPGQLVTLGSSTDRWTAADGRPLIDSDFSASSFMLVIQLSKPNTTLSVDYATVRVSYAATTDSVVQFPSVVYTFGDISAQVGKNGPPPSSNTGDLFEDALVVNDVNAPALIRYSVPGDPESFPETYFVDFETRDNDNVTNIKVVNGRLMVMLQTSVARVSYLPSERDSSFDRGKAFEWLSRSYGCVNPMCACVYSRDGGSETLAFVSDHGVHTTDGYNFSTLTDGLDWSLIISRTSTSNAICLIDDRDRQELLFYYRNDSNGNETYLCLHFSYATEHLVDGKPKVSGPVHMRNFLSAGTLRASLESAWSSRRTSGAQDIYLGYGGTATGAGAGFVYRETGTTIPSQDDTLKYATRRMYLADMGNEWRMNELYGYVGSYAGTPNVTYTPNLTKTNDAGAVNAGSKSIALGGGPLHKVQFDQMVEGVIVTAQVTATTFAQERLIIDGEGFGVEDSGR